MKNRNGITLISLIITIIILLILASIATYSGTEIIKSSQLTAFTTEMKIMQTQVNEFYQKFQNNEKILIDKEEINILELGEDLSQVQAQADIVFTEGASGIQDSNGYRYWNHEWIQKLGIEGIEQEFFVNIPKRSVVSYEGFKYEKDIYYTIEQLPSTWYHVEYENKNINIEPPTFNVSLEKISQSKWKVTISNIQYKGYIGKWKVNYQLEGQNDWKTTEDLSFTVNQEGSYRIKIVNENIESKEESVVILPSQYQQVEYIASTGTQYIDTKIPMSSINRINTKIQFTSFVSNEHQGICGRYTSNHSSFQILYNAQDEKISTIWLNQKLSIPKDLEIHEIELSNSKIRIDENSKQIDENLVTAMDSLYIFARRQDNSGDQIQQQQYSFIKMYEFDIYTNSKLAQRLIPCYRKSDNEVGMYDIINRRFYTNQGTGTFEKGNNVNI
ncbi:MAG: hypothetical protein HFJ37_01435 [Clostridia bacterium]|nr:hypothetical protein [Clostridia bacterium]